MKLSTAPALASKLYSVELPAVPLNPATGALLVSAMALGAQLSVAGPQGSSSTASSAALASTIPLPIRGAGRRSHREGATGLLEQGFDRSRGQRAIAQTDGRALHQRHDAGHVRRGHRGAA